MLATGAAFAAWFSGLRRLDAGAVGIIGLLNPLTGVLLGALIGGEPLTPRRLGGLAMVFVGLASLALIRDPSRPPASAADRGPMPVPEPR